MVQTMFGGSVRRRTYVTGLSDVDVLLIVNQSSLVNQPPSEAIAYVQDTIQRRLQNNSVTAGDLAVTVGYSDGTEIQILPAAPLTTKSISRLLRFSISAYLMNTSLASFLFRFSTASGSVLLSCVSLFNLSPRESTDGLLNSSFDGRTLRLALLV